MMKMRNIQTELNKLAKFKNKSIIFSKFDLADGYSSIKIAERYQKYVCFSTHRGIFRMTRLGQGLASAPMSFQEVMNLTEKEIWRKIKEYGGLDEEIVIMNYFDDLLIATTNVNQMWIAVMSLGEVLDMKGFRINPSKAEFLTETVEFLGHKLNGNEVSISDSKSEAIKQLKVPNSREELRSVLGMLNYHLDYTPSLAIIRNPLDRVLKLNEFRPLNKEEVEAFHSCINAVVNSIKLVQIDKGESLIVETDSSNFAIADVLKCSDGRIARCFSRNLRGPELNYPIQHKECLAIIESIKKFKYWLLLQKFQVITDHQSLEILFRRDNEVSRTAANRLKRWMYELIQYDYEVKFVGGKNVATADCLTRLINQARENYLGEEIIIGKINESSYAVDCEKIRNTMDEDYLKYKKILEEGEIIDSFGEKKHDMFVGSNLIFIGNKLLIPKDVQEECLQLLHATHASPPKMKARAREEMFWKTMTVDIENYYKKCDKCQLFMKMPSKVKDQWPVAIEFLERIHMDACKTRRGGVNVLVLQDAFSGFTDLFILNSMDPYSVRKYYLDSSVIMGYLSFLLVTKVQILQIM
uniref:RNA-directed DNA polymerase n=1 Tax=Strongyloides papillosus TaxID=174720 RepID=A0A0N5BIP8_STREA